MIRLVEHLPNVNPDPLGLPDAVMTRPTIIAVLDGVKGDVIIVSPAYANSGLSAKAAYAQAAERVMDAARALERPVPLTSREMDNGETVGEPKSNSQNRLPCSGRKATTTSKRRHLSGETGSTLVTGFP